MEGTDHVEPDWAMQAPDAPFVFRRFAQLMAARRRKVERPCAVCGRLMVATVRRRYCSPACSSRAYRQRQGVAYRERRRAQRQARKPAPPTTGTEGVLPADQHPESAP